MSYTPITQVIAPLPPAPNSLTDTPSVFNTKANEWVSKLETPYTPSLNTLSTQMNVVAEEINQTVATLPAGLIQDGAPSATDTYSSNKIEELTGTNPSSGWNGVAGTTEQELRDFYNNQTIAIQGSNLTFKMYPDGSVVGSTTNGSFELRANGRVECSKASVGALNVYTPIGVVYEGHKEMVYPIKFTSGNVPIISSSAKAVQAGYNWASAHELVTVDGFRLRIFGSSSTGAADASYTATGRWK